MKTVIEIPEDCSRCPCHVTAEAVIGQNKVFYLCRAYGRILDIGVNGFGSVKGVARCEECKDAEIKAEKIITQGGDEQCQ